MLLPARGIPVWTLGAISHCRFSNDRLFFTRSYFFFYMDGHIGDEKVKR